MSESTLPLSRVLDALAQIAPLHLAADWDNVGLLLEPAPWPRTCRRALLTIDLSEAVLAEALEAEADLVVAYHPPIFGGLKRLTAGAPLQRVVLEAARRGVAIYSPHTALDAAPGGINEWLAEGLGELTATAPIEPLDDTGSIGQGRIAELRTPITLPELVARLKAHLGLHHLRLAAAPAHAQGGTFRRIALCPGAGESVFERLRGPEVFVTGEMRHHSVLARVAAGESVVLTEHTNTERGYLPVLQRRLSEALSGALDVRVSAVDRDPLEVV